MVDYSKMLSRTVVDLKKSGIRKFFDLLNDPNMKDVVGLTVGQPDFVTPWHIREAGIESLQKGKTYYTGNAGTDELREEISKYLQRRFSLSYQPSETLVTVGGSEAIDLAIRAVVEPGDEVIIPTPCFVCYEPIVRMMGGVPVTLPTKIENNFKLTPGPPSVLPPTSLYLLAVILLLSSKVPVRFVTGVTIMSSPNLPTYPSSEHFAAITDDKLSISAMVTVPYSDGIAPQAEPELSDKHIVFPESLGRLSIAMSIHSSRASRIIGL